MTKQPASLPREHREGWRRKKKPCSLYLQSSSGAMLGESVPGKIRLLKIDMLQRLSCKKHSCSSSEEEMRWSCA